LQEGSMFFEQKSGLHLTLRNITQRLRKLNIPYAVAGGMAMFFHGFRRFTEVPCDRRLPRRRKTEACSVPRS